MLALTREISPAIARCELTHVTREPIDVGRAREQHRAYERALERLGCSVRRLPSDATMPDSVFIEDTAVVLPEVAVIARPGATSRREEIAAVVAALAPLRPLAWIADPGTLDGGDVVLLGREIFVGRSSRTNDAGIDQLRATAMAHGYTVTTVATAGCLHLKSAVTALDGRAVLLNPERVAPAVFDRYMRIEVDASEPGAGNVVSIDGALMAAAAYPRTCERLEQHGFHVLRVDASELAKAEGALTCCSLLVA